MKKKYFICVDFMKIDEKGFSSEAKYASFFGSKYATFFGLCRILLGLLFTSKYKEISVRKE